MPIKNILVSYNATEAASSALKLGLLMAQKYDAHLTGVLSYGPQEIISSYAGYLPAGVAEQLAEADRARRDEIEKTFLATTADLPQERRHFKDVFSSADEGLMEISRCFDLVVMGTPDSRSDIPHMEPHPDIVARHSGRPILVVPKGYEVERLNEKAVVAWDGGRAAARAVADAMHMLETKDEVTLLTVGDPSDTTILRDITTHLNRHGVKTVPRIKPRDGHRVASVILDTCAETGAGLLIMGAYEHSKFAEDLFGGVTNTVLEGSHIPVLMSH
ncbi:MAG: universal stress protein [Alphaproteobacteria bacterium]|nr:MAG: universal stress protein [Alphaproteobacteria bacterium]